VVCLFISNFFGHSNFINVNNILRSQVRDAWWCVVVRGGAWWCVVVRGGAWWCVVMRGDACDAW
jgi:hypothetical protein